MWQIRTGMSKNPRVINGYATPVELGKTFVPLFSWTSPSYEVKKTLECCT